MFNLLTQVNTDLIVQAIASIASVAATFLAYLSIRQVSKITKSSQSADVKKYTISLLSDNETGLARLSGKAWSEREKQFPEFKWTNEDISERLSNIEDKLDNETASYLLRRIKERFPLVYKTDLPDEVVSTVNRLIHFKPVAMTTEYHKSTAYFFNKLEDITNALNCGLVSFELIDQMYGSLIISTYEEHSDWFYSIKRKLGFRVFDQSEELVHALVNKNSERFNPNGLRFKFYMLLRLKFSYFRYIIDSKPKQELTRNAVLKILKNTKQEHEKQLGLDPFKVEYPQIRAPRSIDRLQSSNKFKKEIQSLFSESWRESKGVWPVGMGLSTRKNYRLLDSELESWYDYSVSEWSYCINAVERRGKIVGNISLSVGNQLKMQKERWEKELLQAAKFSGYETPKAAIDYLKKLGVPTRSLRGEEHIDFDQLAMLRSLYVNKEWREHPSASIGHKLLIESLMFCRNKLSKVAFLSVIADSSYTEKAIKLYAKEGGAFIGTCRDACIEDQHLMHIFVF